MTTLLCSEINIDHLQSLLGRYGMVVKIVNNNESIPGSFWKAPEAGLIGNTLYVSNDTPLHSALHETCHYICMDKNRRDNLDTDAGGDFEEEDAVCYLQIILADNFSEMGRERMFKDMDSWGYSFRLGSAKSWFDKDAEDAEQWLLSRQIISYEKKPTWQLRTK